MKGKFSEVWNRLEIWLGLRMSPGERLRYIEDPYNIFFDPLWDRKPIRTATVIAILFHILIFLIVFPTGARQILFQPPELIQIKRIAGPPAGGSDVRAAPPKVVTAPKPTPTFIPIPDPTPDAPEPVRTERLEATTIVQQISENINIGDITAPPGPPGAGSGLGQGVGNSTGSAGGGDGIFAVGGGVTDPVLLVETRPSYTDEAIKAKVQGIVLLQGVVRKNGIVDSLKVVRSLGYGLDDRAIQEIGTKWRFKPGTLNGRPVDVYATIEVTFTLR